MSNLRFPGPVCQDRHPLTIRDGTLIRWPSKIPGSIGRETASLPSWPVPSRDAVFSAAIPFFIKEEAVPLHPYWPGGNSSGVTWGLGWDAGGRTEQEIRSTWSKLPKQDLDRLVGVRGKRGLAAKEEIPGIRDIQIPKNVSLEVFTTISLPAYYEMSLNAFPGMNRLPLRTQVALVSLVFNRGSRMDKDRHNDKGGVVLDSRFEMRRIRDAVLNADLPEIAEQLRLMERIWKGKDIEKGMTARREHEASLVDIDSKLYSPANLVLVP